MRSLLVLCLLSATAVADPVVLAVDGKDIYVELGAPTDPSETDDAAAPAIAS